jgi:hypothetical protein
VVLATVVVLTGLAEMCPTASRTVAVARTEMNPFMFRCEKVYVGGEVVVDESGRRRGVRTCWRSIPIFIQKSIF